MKANASVRVKETLREVVRLPEVVASFLFRSLWQAPLSRSVEIRIEGLQRLSRGRTKSISILDYTSLAREVCLDRPHLFRGEKLNP